MKSPHCFATWFMLKKIQPKFIVESGVALGAGTWILEQACPQAVIHSVDVDLSNLQYRSSRVTYHDRDINLIDWSALPSDDTLFFIDDHQNALERLKLISWMG